MLQILVDESNVVIAYPATLADLRRRHPQVSFPVNGPEDLLASYGLHAVLPAEPPAHDSFSQQVVEDDPVLTADGWQQVWQVVAVSPDQLVYRCDYQAFWDALLISPIYQVIRAQAISDLNVNTCCTEFIAAMTDAKAGHPNRDALQMCIWLLMAALTLTPEEQAELQEVLAVGSMSRIYSLAPAQ